MLVAALLSVAVLLLLASIRSRSVTEFRVRLGLVHFALSNIVPASEFILAALLVLVAISFLVVAMDMWAFSRTTSPELLHRPDTHYAAASRRHHELAPGRGESAGYRSGSRA